MQDLIQTDIFFFVTTVAVVVVAIFILIALVYLIQILRNVKSVSEVAKKKAIFLALDSPILRKWIRSIFQLFSGDQQRKKKRRRIV